MKLEFSQIFKNNPTTHLTKIRRMVLCGRTDRQTDKVNSHLIQFLELA
jgi:hypothetical protein